MKKSLIILLAMLLAMLVLAGCGEEPVVQTQPTETEPVLEETQPEETLPFPFTSEQFLKIKDCLNYAPSAKCLGVKEDGQFLAVKDPDGQVEVMQGGCTDGDYFYFAIEGSNLKIGDTMYGKAHKIFKVDAKTWETVAISELLPLDHANSMCYNGKLDLLLVANCNDVVKNDDLDNTKAVTFIDPDTLEIVDVKYLDIAINAIDYSETYDLYVVGIKGSSAAFAVLDANFVELGYYEGHNLGLAAQDVGCDDDYIFLGNSGVGTAVAGTEIVKVYDWDGEYKGVFRVGYVSEQEAVFAWDGKYYITFFTNPGGRLFELDLDTSLLED